MNLAEYVDTVARHVAEVGGRRRSRCLDALAEVAAARARVERAQAALVEAVTQARGAGASWASVGGALGVSKQAAAARWRFVERR